MPTIVNGKTSYVTRTSGTKTYFIQLGTGTTSDPYVGLTAADKSYLDAAETAAAGASQPLKTYLEGQTHSKTGLNAWVVYGGLEQVYDTAANKTIIAADAVAATGIPVNDAGTTSVALKTDHDALVEKVNALQNLVESMLKSVRVK